MKDSWDTRIDFGLIVEYLIFQSYEWPIFLNTFSKISSSEPVKTSQASMKFLRETSFLGDLSFSICSNLKSDGKPVVIKGDANYETGIRKIGAILADGADIGCGCVLNPGTIIGKNTSVYPLNALRGVFPSGCIVKDSKNIVKRI